MRIKVFVTGSCNSGVTGIPNEFERDCQKLGELLAREKCEVLICALGIETADRYIFNGVYNVINEASGEPYLAIRLYSAMNDHSNDPENSQILDKIKQLRDQGWAQIERTPDISWIFAHTRAIAQADLLFVAAAKESKTVSQIICMAEELAKVPILALANSTYEFGNTLYKNLYYYHLNNGVSKNMYSALEGPLDESHNLKMISALIKDVAPSSRKHSRSSIFIGHGRSSSWEPLKKYITDELHLQHEEFDRIPVEGTSITDRLSHMLDNAAIAFLIMTAEDEHYDGTKHARLNVIHEVGLFQGKLGFQRAIVLLEDGCEEFSNNQGLVPIKFPKGDISAAFPKVRKVLEREKLI